MAKYNAVTLIEQEDGIILSVQVFSDDKAGNKEVEKAFVERILIHTSKSKAKNPRVIVTKKELEAYSDNIEDGYFDGKLNGYSVSICHSTIF